MDAAILLLGLFADWPDGVAVRCFPPIVRDVHIAVDDADAVSVSLKRSLTESWYRRARLTTETLPIAIALEYRRNRIRTIFNIHWRGYSDTKLGSYPQIRFASGDWEPLPVQRDIQEPGRWLDTFEYIADVYYQGEYESYALEARKAIERAEYEAIGYDWCSYLYPYGSGTGFFEVKARKPQKPAWLDWELSPSIPLSTP